LMLCDGNFSDAEKSVAHVVGDLHVPAVIAGFRPADLTLFAQNYFAATEDGGAFKHPVFVVNPNPPAAQLRYYKEKVGGLVMNLLGPAEDLAAVYTPLVAKAASYLAAPGSFRESYPVTPGALRVAVVHEQGEPYYDELADTLRNGPWVTSPNGLERDATRALRFNNGSLAENKTGGRFEDIKIASGAGYEGVATELASFKPDVIIALTTQQVEFASGQFSGLVPRIEEELKKTQPQTMPLWILRNARHVVPFLQQTAQNQLQRFVGITYASAVDGAEERTKWLERMGTQYDAATVNEWSWTENFYDAVYWLVYGYYAAKSSGSLLSGGAALSVAIQGKLLPADPSTAVVVRPGDPLFVQSQFPIIRDNPRVMFRGALGDSKIPFSTMTWESVGSVYCFWINGFQVDIRYDHLRYNPADGGLYMPPYDGGSPSCF
jgi:hypothetical protein